MCSITVVFHPLPLDLLIRLAFYFVRQVQYVFDPAALDILKRFRDNLSKVGDSIEERNKTRKVVYDTLHPTWVPNAISA